ncbi:MAG: hypothetical protein O4805_07435 [Trichodesmium sp. St16_bin2-tuft]|nr:hypothetical protein [Trichodesmium sp. St16_bin2-tuft]MDE5109873.1 hypothetical protein [Trichodesmium sp. St7_bin2_1]
MYKKSSQELGHDTNDSGIIGKITISQFAWVSPEYIKLLVL